MPGLWAEWPAPGVQEDRPMSHPSVDEGLPPPPPSWSALGPQATRLPSAAALPVAPVALTALHLGLRLFPAILRERLADVVGFLERTPRTAADEPLVAAGVDQFALSGCPLPGRRFRCFPCCLLCHAVSLCNRGAALDWRHGGNGQGKLHRSDAAAQD